MIRLATFWVFVLAIGALGQAQQSFLLIPDWDERPRVRVQPRRRQPHQRELHPDEQGLI
jgi:hypothetical protein